MLAGELGLPLFQVRLDGLITKMQGETAAKLRQVFDSTGHTRGVYFFDEHHGQILDPALLWRFDVLHYELPSPKQIAALLRARLGHVSVKGVGRGSPALATGLSHAEVTRAGDEALKEALIAERMPLRQAGPRATLEERQHAASQLNRNG